jgi:prevent-host-death family protein
MERIGVRELRQNASEWIRRANAGERIEVTRRGEVMAVLGPPPSIGGLAGLREAGRLKRATVTGPLPMPVATSRPASQALAELRADER